MALYVETGSGSSNSDSFASVADADAYFANYGVPTGWTTCEKEIALRLATQYIESVYSLLWVGQRAIQTQSLSWPRINAFAIDGLLILSNIVPSLVKTATIILAGKSLGTTLIPGDVSPGIASESVSVGPISESITYAGTKPVTARYPEVDALLRSLIGSPGTVRIVRG